MVTGRSEEGVAEMTLALKLDPLSPLRNADLASIFNLARQYDRTIKQGLKTVDLFPNYSYGHWYLGRAYFPGLKVNLARA